MGRKRVMANSLLCTAFRRQMGKGEEGDTSMARHLICENCKKGKNETMSPV